MPGCTEWGQGMDQVCEPFFACCSMRGVPRHRRRGSARRPARVERRRRLLGALGLRHAAGLARAETGAAGRCAGVDRAAAAGLHAPGPARAGLRRRSERGLRLPLGRRQPARPAGPGAPPGQPEAGRAVLRRPGRAGRGGACHQQRADRRARPGDRPAAQRAGALAGASAHQRHRRVPRPAGALPASGSSCCARCCRRRSAVNLLWDASTGPWQLAAAKAAAQKQRFDVDTLVVRDESEFEQELADGMSRKPDALVLLSSPLVRARSKPIAEFCIKQRLPAISPFNEFRAGRRADVLWPERAGLLPACGRLRRQDPEGRARRRSAAEPADAVPARCSTCARPRQLGLVLPPALLAAASEVIR